MMPDRLCLPLSLALHAMGFYPGQLFALLIQ